MGSATPRCKMGKTESFSVSLTVNNFSEVKEDLLSPPVIVHNLKWRILIKPSNIEQDGQQKKILGYYLSLTDEGSEASSWACQATVDLRVMAAKQGMDIVSRKFSYLFHSKSKSLGYKEYMKWADVESTERGLIEDNSVTFLVRVTADEPLRCERCEERVCKVCLKEEVNIFFDPCGHICTCTKCSTEFNECPICRGKINKKMRAFF